MARRVVAYTDSNEFGGAEQSLGNLLEVLSSDYEVIVAGIDETVVSTIAARRRGASSSILPAVRHKGDAGGFLAHVRAFRRLRPDVFHANLSSPMACRYGILAALLAPGARVIAVEHSPIAISSRTQRRLKHLLSTRLAAHVAVGRRSARMVENIAGLPSGSVRTIYNGVPEVTWKTSTPLLPSPVVGASGRFSHEKGFDVLLRALARLPGVNAILIGDGPQRPVLERLAGELGVRDRLAITGWVPHARRYLASLDLLVVPSRFEGFPLVIPEGMLAGLATVASDIGSVSEAVIEGETGLLVPPEDPESLAGALRHLLADIEAREAMGKRALAVARERFTATAMARAFESLYAEVVA